VDDAQIVKQIDELVDEEHRLERDHVGDGLSAADQARLKDVEVQLDRAWDLLRRRRARRHAGLDPDGAVVEPASVVEGYQQ
jgi:hypothetical protein